MQHLGETQPAITKYPSKLATRKIRKPLLALTAIVSLILSATAIPASGTPEPTELIVGGQGTEIPDQLSSQDAAAIAESLGLSKAEAMERFEGQDLFNEAIGQIEASDKGYSTSAWDPTPEFKGTISFKGNPSDATLDTLKSLPFQVRVENNAAATAVERQSALELAFTELQSIEGIDEVSGWLDQQTNTIELEYSLDDTNAEFRRAPDLGDEVGKISAQIPIPIGLNVANTEDAGGEPQVARGGSVFGGCTSGFAVFQGNLRGVVTAGHCPNNLFLSGSGATTYRGGHEGSYGDFQWHSTTDVTSNQINISRSGLKRAITGQAIAAVGTSVCNYGQTRIASSCATVNNIAACGQLPGGYTCRFIRTNGTFTQSGDSGGPWYVGNRAYGVHFGFIGGQSSYSRIGNVEAILGVTTKLS